MSVAAVILAAGAGRRLGGVCKALLTTADGVTFLEAIARASAAAGVTDRIVVVAEPHRAASEAEATRLGLACVVNPDPARGMASSIAVGFGHAQRSFPGARAALLWPVDHAQVTVATVTALARGSETSSIDVPVFDQRGGHPTVFGRSFWAALEHCASNPDGARSVLRDNAASVRRLRVGDAGVVRDVDLPADRGRAG